MDDLISRQAAIDALWKALYEYEDKTGKQFQESEDLDVGDWIEHRIFVQNMNDIDRQTILNLPSAHPYTENDYIAEFIKERHPYMLDSFSFSAWKLKRSWYNLCQTFKDALQQRGTVVTCGIDKCKHNDDGLCKAESIYLSEDHACDGGCDDGWAFDEKGEES